MTPNEEKSSELTYLDGVGVCVLSALTVRCRTATYDSWLFDI